MRAVREGQAPQDQPRAFQHHDRQPDGAGAHGTSAAPSRRRPWAGACTGNFHGRLLQPVGGVPIKAKSDVAGVTMDVINMLEKQSGCPLLVVRSDNGSEYINSTLGTFFKEKGVLCQTTVRYTPEQNGKAERLNRTLLDRVRAMLEDSGLPKTLWAEAATTASYLRNRAAGGGAELHTVGGVLRQQAGRVAPARLRSAARMRCSQRSCAASWTATPSAASWWATRPT